jgi:site-specific recombinase XerD
LANLQEIFNRYSDYLKAELNVSDYTYRNYTTDLVGTRTRGEGKGFFQFLKTRKVRTLEEFKAVDRLAVREYKAWLLHQDIAKSSINRKMSAVRSFYKFLLREHILENSPIPLNTRGRSGERSSVSLKVDKRLPYVLNIDDVEKLIEGPDLSKPSGKRDCAIIELFYAAGLRVSELSQLDRRDINWKLRQIRVRGKGKKDRITLIGIPAVMALKDYVQKGRRFYEKPHKPGLSRLSSQGAILRSPKNRGPLFLDRKGQNLKPRSIQKIIKKYAMSAGLDASKVHPHILRHTFATHLLDGGADLRVIQELLGHANVSTTQIYTHVSKVQARKTYMLAHPLAADKDNNSDA